MCLLAFTGFFIILYYIIYVVTLCLIDCDLQLKWSEKFGLPIDSLKGKVIWITGASSGIGEHIAIRLAKSGVKLVLSGRRTEELNRVRDECLEKGKDLKESDVLILPFDMTNTKVHVECAEEVIKVFGKIDMLVCNAGRSQRATWENIDVTVDRELFELNVFSLMSLSRVVVKKFLAQGFGHIAATSSLAGVFPVPFSASYVGSKHALHGYFNSLLTEKMGQNINMTLLCPGPVYTNFLQESFTEISGQKFGKSVGTSDRRLTAQRCAELCCIALANKQREAWMGLFPLMPLAYLLYFPNFGTLVLRLLGPKMLQKLRDSKETVKAE